MMPDLPRDLGPQPLATIMHERGVNAEKLVEASMQQLTFKMVTRAAKGRRLTPHVQAKVLAALNTALDATYATKDLFTY